LLTDILSANYLNIPLRFAFIIPSDSKTGDYSRYLNSGDASVFNPFEAFSLFLPEEV